MCSLRFVKQSSVQVSFSYLSGESAHKSPYLPAESRPPVGLRDRAIVSHQDISMFVEHDAGVDFD